MKALPKNWLSLIKENYFSFKKQKALPCLLLFLFCLNGIGQTFTNLVPNGSFETYTFCPTGSNYGIRSAPPWTAPYNNSADYYNSCHTSSFYNVPHYGGLTGAYSYFYLDAKHGSAYAAIFPFQPTYREYLQVKLNDTLKNNLCYYVEFYAANQQCAKYKCNNISASLISTAYPDNGSSGNLISIPAHIENYGNPVLQDTVMWNKISGIYQAAGNEKYLILGNFKDDSNTDTINLYASGNYCYGLSAFSYIFIDAVSVYSINPLSNLPWTYRDTTVTFGDSVYIGNYMGGNFNPSWYTYTGTFITNNSGIYVKPTVTTDYVVQFTICGVPRRDTLKVSVTGVGINELGMNNEKLRISPNPNNGIFDLEILDKEFIIENTEIRIINVLGQKIKSFMLQNKKQQINLEEFESGIYYLQLASKGIIVSVSKIIKQ